MEEQKDSYSLTPPVSPGFNLEDFMEPSPPKIIKKTNTDEDAKHTGPGVGGFLCGGGVYGLCQPSLLHNSSLVKKGGVKRMLSSLPEAVPVPGSILIELFGCHFVRQIALTEDTEKLFMLAKSCVSAVQCRRNGDEGPMDNRKHLRHFMEYIKEFIRHFLPFDVTRKEIFLSCLVSELHGLLSYAGRLSDCLPFNAGFMNKTDDGHHQFHLLLDLYWTQLDVFNVIYTQFKGLSVCQRLLSVSDETPLEVTYFDQLVQLVLWDLVAAANSRFNKIASVGDYTKVSPFPCTCVQDLWIMLVHLLCHRNKALGEESFWVRLYQILQEVCDDKDGFPDGQTEIDSDVFTVPPFSKPKNSGGVCLWLLTHVAHLFQIDRTGNLCVLEPNHSSYFMLKKILQKQLSVPEMELRCYVYCCLTLAKLWGPDTSLLLLLWDHFYRKLNSNFQVSSASIDGLAQVCKSSQALLRQCRKWSLGGEDGFEKQNSFHLFLCLLSMHLSSFMKTGAVQEWRQMKGRFCSKFHQRRMQELSELGLYNFTCLFLVLAYVAELEDMGKKLCDFYSMLDPCVTSLNRRLIVWSGGLALCQLCGERNVDMSFVATKLSTSFNSVCREYCDSSVDPQQQHSLWRMMSVYLEGLQDVFEASTTLTMSQCKLLGEDVRLVFRVCRDGELRFILSTLQAIVSKFRSVLMSKADSTNAIASASPNDQLQEIFDHLWLYVYPFVKEHAMTSTPPLTLADLATNLCLLAKDKSGLLIPTQESFSSVFQHFSFKDTVHVSIKSHFLCQVLSEDGMMEYLISTNQDSQTQLLQTWFHCVLQLPPSSTQLSTLTSIVIGLPDIQKVFDLARMDVPTDMESTPIMFLKALSKLYANTQDLREKMLLREKVMGYFANVSQQIAPVLKTMGPANTLSTVYHVVGHLIKYCAPMLFAQSLTVCPLPDIINSMIVPHFILKTEKPVNPLFLSAVRNNLHLFVHGLGKLDWKRAPYVHRRLGDIVSIYFTKFPLKSSGSSVTTVHPLLSSLYGSCVFSPSTESVELRHVILEIIHNKYLQIQNFTPPHTAAMTLSFIAEVLHRTKGGEVIARDAKLLLQTIMEYMVLSSPSTSVKQQASNMMRQLLEACSQHPEAVPQSELVRIVQGFLCTNFKLQTEGVFHVLAKLGTNYRSLAASVVPDVTAAVRELERKRGVGVDRNLRKMYISTLGQLGDTGAEEIQKLQLEGNT